MAVSVRQCSTCRIGPGGAPWANAATNLDNFSAMCAYVREGDAEQVGRCMYGEVSPPAPCGTCQTGLGANLMTGCTQNQKPPGVCVNGNFKNYISRPR